MTSTAYSRSSKLPGGGERRLPPRLMRTLTSKIEPKKLGIGLIAGCCLALLTYVSLAKLFAIYSPVFASTANTSALMPHNSPPSKPSVPETEAIPEPGLPEAVTRKEMAPGSDEPGLPETAAGVEEPGLPAAVTRNEMTAGSDEPGLPGALTRKKDDAETTAGASKGEEKQSNGGAAAAAAAAAASGQGTMTCDENGVDEGFPYARPTVCELSGDIRVSPKHKTIYLVNGAGGAFDASGEKRLRPYARKDPFLLPGVTEVTVKSTAPSAAPACTKHHAVPAVVFSNAGYTDNFFHDMTDALIPLFLTAAHLGGQVQLLLTNYKPWWVQKYTPLLRNLSSYDVINFDADAGVHCFPRGFVGLYRDRDLILSPHPTRNPRNYTMVHFNRFLRAALALPRDRPAALGEEPGVRPRMLIISRAGTRKLLNLDEVAAAASDLGFNVTVAEAGADVPAFAAQVNAADVLLAVHGAGLTNQIFLPTGAVVLQIVPWGKMDWMATNFYGQPAKDMHLRYLEYYVGEEETSLKDKYPREHLVFKDPMALHKQGWQALAETVMKQDVRVNITRFRPFLLQALDNLQD